MVVAEGVHAASPWGGGRGGVCVLFSLLPVTPSPLFPCVGGPAALGSCGFFAGHPGGKRIPLSQSLQQMFRPQSSRAPRAAWASAAQSVRSRTFCAGCGGTAGPPGLWERVRVAPEGRCRCSCPKKGVRGRAGKSTVSMVTICSINGGDDFMGGTEVVSYSGFCFF